MYIYTYIYIEIKEKTLINVEKQIIDYISILPFTHPDLHAISNRSHVEKALATKFRYQISIKPSQLKKIENFNPS